MSLGMPPPFDSLADRERCDHTAKRRALLYSRHESLLRQELVARVGEVRAEAYGRPDTTANPYLSLWSQIAVMYDAEPRTMAPAGSEALCEMMADVGYWPGMQRVERDTLGLREMLVRFEADPVDGVVTHRPVFPDLVSAEAEARRPDVPIRIREWVDGPFGWELHDTSIAGVPFHRVYDASGKVDVTADRYGRTFEGAAYPYRYSNGAPRLPYTLYHAAKTGFLFDPWTLREIVDGSLILGVYLSFFGHVLQNAAHSQRYMFGVNPHGAAVVGREGVQRTEVVADPATIFTGDVAEGVNSPIIGQWSPPVNAAELLASISMYERRLLLLANVQPSDVTRQEADIRSGYSLAVSRESVRAAQALYQPQFLRGDQDAMVCAAVISNRVFGTSYSERPRDYRIAYQGLPESPGELEALSKGIQTELDAGRIGPVTAYKRRYPGTTDEEACAALVDASIEREVVEARIREARMAEVDRAVVNDTGKAQAVSELVAKVGRGEVPVEAACVIMVSVIGLSQETAEAICDTLETPAEEGAEPEPPESADPVEAPETMEPPEPEDAAGGESMTMTEAEDPAATE